MPTTGELNRLALLNFVVHYSMSPKFMVSRVPSSTPNMEPRMIFVNGDMRIGFFAKHDIDAQSEVSNRELQFLPN
jgi:hypothetical protein